MEELTITFNVLDSFFNEAKNKSDIKEMELINNIKNKLISKVFNHIQKKI